MSSGFLHSLTDSHHRFSPSTDIAGQSALKSSVQRSIRAQLLETLSIDAETLEQIWPKKENLIQVKWHVIHNLDAALLIAVVCSREHITIFTLHGVPLFFQHFDDKIMPSLRLVHKCKLVLQTGSRVSDASGLQTPACCRTSRSIEAPSVTYSQAHI